MSRSDSGDECAVHLRHLREHVLTTVETAADLADQEQVELKVEKTSLEEFVERVGALTPTPIQSSRVNQQFDAKNVSTLADVRDAYRSTVMAVPHFEKQYNESLIKHISEELGPEIASAVHPDTVTKFTPFVQKSIQQAAKRRASKRQALLEVLDREVCSLMTTQNQLRDLIERVFSKGIPICSCSTIAKQLQDIATTRQHVLSERPSLKMARINEVCSYLYTTPSWTYPVLVSVCRLREAAIS